MNTMLLLCCTLVRITAIIVVGALLWRLMDHIAKRCQESRKHEWEVEECGRKQESDLLDKKLQILCETCYDLNKDEPKKVVKKYNDEAVKNYITKLEAASRTKSTSKTGTDE